MSDDLHRYYSQELDYIRNLGSEFADAEQNKKIASRLRWARDTVDDPHVERLIQAFAFLNARIRRKLDDDFPELADSLLGVLYPHFLSPIPSMSIVQFVPDPNMSVQCSFPKGTPIETDPIDGEPFKFKTAYPVTLWPIEVKSVKYVGRVDNVHGIDGLHGMRSTLRLVVGCIDPDLTFSKLKPQKLRFYLNGSSEHMLPLYEILFNNAKKLVIESGGNKKKLTVRSGQVLKTVGFRSDESLLPPTARTHTGYSLLSDFFAFPEKFLFFEIDDVGDDVLENSGNQLEFNFYFNRLNDSLEKTITENTFALGCTPVVNLFDKRAEPINLDQQRTEYHVVPDARRFKAHEIYSIDEVIASDSNGKYLNYRPFYGLDHLSNSENDKSFWCASRRESGYQDLAKEIYLTLVDLNFDPSIEKDTTLSVKTTCLNRDLASKLPFGGGEPRLRLAKGSVPIEIIQCLTPPTKVLRPQTKKGNLWKIVSHLSLNYLSISGQENGVKALQEILLLYNLKNSAETRAMIEGIQSIDSEMTNARVSTRGGSAFCQGTSVTVQFKERNYTGESVYLFASVLEQFFALYCSINSFTRFTAKTDTREGVLKKWPARTGTQRLV